MTSGLRCAGVSLATKLVFVRFSTILKGSHCQRCKQYNDLATKTDFVFFQQSFDHLETGNDPKHDLLTNKTTTTKTLTASVILERFIPPSPDFSECDHDDDEDDFCCYG